ncbi:hypothetical protein P7C73_g2754, partial [Tremellales sp. Uapishka_1]
MSTISITASLAVRALEKDTFQSLSLWLPCGARGVFGGQVIGQALLSASKTVQSLGLHSQHREADPTVPIVYVVERLRDGTSHIGIRLIEQVDPTPPALQRDRPIFILIASYTTPPLPLPSHFPASTPTRRDGDETSEAHLSHSLRFALTPSPSPSSALSADARGLRDKAEPPIPFAESYQIPFPSGLLPWEACEEEEVRWDKFLQQRGESYGGKRRIAVEEYIEERRRSPISLAVAKKSPNAKGGEERSTRLMWMRARMHEGETVDEEFIKAMFAYMTDFQFIGTASKSVGLTRSSTPRLGMLASLDHTTHFYPLPPNFDPSTPLLHVMESPLTHVASGRGVVRGLLFTASGQLVAVTSQEGVVRADLKGMEERGLLEGRGVGEEEEGVRSKL